MRAKTPKHEKVPCDCWIYPKTCSAVWGGMEATCLGCDLPAALNTNASAALMQLWQEHIAELRRANDNG